MSDVPAVELGRELEVRRRWAERAWLRGFRRFFKYSPIGGACLLFLIVLMIAAVLADRLAPYDPLTANYAITRLPPSAGHLLGADHLGRDVLSRIIFGARVTLLVAFSSVLLGDSVGFTWGILSGYFGGKVDLFSQRVLDVLMSFPGLILALLLMVGLGAGIQTVIVAIAVTRVPMSTRVVRSMVLAVKESAYIDAARVIGASPPRIMTVHVAPQCVAPFLIITSAHLGGGYLYRGRSELPRCWCASPNTELGQYAWGSARRGVQAAVVDGSVSRCGHHRDHLGS